MGILQMGILGMGILGMDILVGNGNIEWEYWTGETLSVWENLRLGPIRKLVCDGREALFLAFLERFQCWNSCTANFLGHVTSRHMRDSTSRLDPFRLSRFRDRILIPQYCDPSE
jgi:hypothetical protein